MRQPDLTRWMDQVPAVLAEAWRWAVPRLLQSLLLLALGAALYLVTRWVLDRFERHVTSRTPSIIDDLVVQLVRRCALISVGFWMAWRLATLWGLQTMADVVGAVWIVAVAVPVSGFVAQVLRVLEERVAPRTRTTLDDTALPLINKVLRFLILGIAAAMALTRLGVNITPLVAGAGVAGIAVSFAAKDTLSNVIAGVLLVLDRPFQVGDRIELWTAPAESATWGDVVEIGLRATKIRTPDNLVVVIPNNEIMRRDIVNYTASGPEIRVRIPIGIAYTADARQAKSLILEVARQTEGVLRDPAPEVITRSFGDSSVNLELRAWVRDARRRRAVADEITDRVKEAFDRHGVEIPYPKRDLYIRALPGSEAVAGLSAPGAAGSRAGSEPVRGGSGGRPPGGSDAGPPGGADAPAGAVKRAQEVADRPLQGARATRIQVLVGPDDGAPNFVMRRIVMDEAGGMPAHCNTVEHEQYVLRGRARIGIGDRVHEVGPNEAVFIPAGTPHWYEVIEAPFEFLCVVPNAEDRVRILEPRAEGRRTASSPGPRGGRAGGS